MELLHNRLLTKLHLLIREYALIIGKDEYGVKATLKLEMGVESFGKEKEQEIARACGIMEQKISEEIEKQKHEPHTD